MKRLAVLLFTASAFGQATFPEAWPSYNGDTSGRRYSTLSTINQSNIDNLSLAWVWRVNPGSLLKKRNTTQSTHEKYAVLKGWGK